MQYQPLSTGPEKTYVVVFQEGDTFNEGMNEFARREKLTAAQLVAIGAFSEVELAWFDPDERKYEKRRFAEQLEVLSLVGNIADDSGEPKIHAHAVLGRRDMTTIGGHLIQGRVRPTLEVTVSESPAHLNRIHDPKTGLALIRPGVASAPRASRDAQASESPSGDDVEETQETTGVGLGLGFAIQKPVRANDWKQCPNCQMWVHGLNRPSCPNCGQMFAETALA